MLTTIAFTHGGWFVCGSEYFPSTHLSAGTQYVTTTRLCEKGGSNDNNYGPALPPPLKNTRKRQLCAVVSSNSRQSLPKNWVSNHFILMSTSSSSAAAVADRPQPSPVKLIERLAKGQGLGQGYGAQGMRRANNEVFGKFRSLARVFLCAPQIRHTIVESICAILCCRN